MTFWDSSAIVPLTLHDDGSEDVRAILRDDEHMMVWWGTPVEVLSALARSERAHAIETAHVDLAPTDSSRSMRDSRRPRARRAST